MKRILFWLLAPCTLLLAAAQAQIAANAVRTRVGDINLVAYKTGVKDVVYLRGVMPAGDDKAPDDNSMLPTLVGGMLDRGTTQQDKLTLAAKLDAVGASINFSVGSTTLEFTGRCLAKDVPLVASLIAEQLRSPAFSAEELDKLKKQTIGGLTRALESTDFRATDAFSRAVYPAGHPNHQPPVEEQIAAIEKTTVDDLKKFHATHYGPAHLTIVAVGDVDAALVQTELGRAFAGWSGGTPPLAAPAKAGQTDSARDIAVNMPDKTSVNILIGQSTGLRYGEDDYLALRVGTSVLGGPSFSGRLMKNTREKEGLTYGIYSNLANDTFVDGDFRLNATFAPALLEQGIASAKRHLNEWYQNGVTAKELADHQGNMVGSFKIALATTGGMAQALVSTLNRGKDISWLDEFPQRVNALTVEQVNGAIKKHLNPEEMIVVKAGTIPGAAPEKK